MNEKKLKVIKSLFDGFIPGQKDDVFLQRANSPVSEEALKEELKKINLDGLFSISRFNEYINISITNPHNYLDVVEEHTSYCKKTISLIHQNKPEEVKSGKKILVDFGGSNIGKVLHLGNIRSIIVGDSLRRIFLALGYECHGDIHMGDGTFNVAVIIFALIEAHQGDESKIDYTKYNLENFHDFYVSVNKRIESGEIQREDVEKVGLIFQNACIHDSKHFFVHLVGI